MRSARSPRLLKRLLRPPFVLAAALLLVGLILPAAIGATGTTKVANTASTATTAASCATTDLALNKTATSSSTESAAYPASNAVDGAITLVMTRMDAVLAVSSADRRSGSPLPRSSSSEHTTSWGRSRSSTLRPATHSATTPSATRPTRSSARSCCRT